MQGKVTCQVVIRLWGSGVSGLHGVWVRKGLDEQVAFKYRPEWVSEGAMLTSRPRDTASAKALR